MTSFNRLPVQGLPLIDCLSGAFLFFAGLHTHGTWFCHLDMHGFKGGFFIRVHEYALSLPLLYVTSVCPVHNAQVCYFKQPLAPPLVARSFAFPLRFFTPSSSPRLILSCPCWPPLAWSFIVRPSPARAGPTRSVFLRPPSRLVVSSANVLSPLARGRISLCTYCSTDFRGRNFCIG